MPPEEKNHRPSQVDGTNLHSELRPDLRESPVPIARRFLLLSILAAPALAAVTIYSTVSAQPPAKSAVADPVAKLEGSLRWEGVGSCAASACHGQKVLPGASPLQCAVTKWTKDDPHGRAVLTLRSDRSKRILANYRNSGKLATAHPDTEPLCLKCHAMQVAVDKQGPKFDATEGVGCESCHGPAGEWKSMHDLPTWQALSEQEKASHGFRSLRNAATRVAACANCHLGNADHDVNHDLIGAGHPALFFDFSGQMARLPNHWDPQIDRSSPDFAARLWVLGQVSSARASIELLKARANDTTKAWPEFSEYDCVACHRNIHVRDRIPRERPPGTALGQAPYLAWNQSTIEALAKQGKSADAELPRLLAELRSEVSKPYPNRKEVENKAAAVVARLNAYIDRLGGSSISEADLRAVFKELAAQGHKQDLFWYQGFQAAVTMSTLNDAIGDLNPNHPRARYEATLKTLRERFPKPTTENWLDVEKHKQSIDLLKSLSDQLK
jgi:hypothetical protein